MYLVVSNWEPLPGKEDAFREIGTQVRHALAALPGVVMIEGFKSDSGKYIAVHAYQDEDTYKAIVQDPNGPFTKALAKFELETTARWVSSERGPSLP